MLGEWKDETAAYGPGCVGQDFVSVAAKTYSLNIVSPEGELVKRIIKAKGISLSSGLEETLSNRQMKDILHHGGVLKLPQLQFKKNLSIQTIEVKRLVKRFALTQSKRRILEGSPTLATVPFGSILKQDCEKFQNERVGGTADGNEGSSAAADGRGASVAGEVGE